MEKFTIKGMAVDLVKKASFYVGPFHSHIAKEVFDVIQKYYLGDYEDIVRMTSKITANQVIGKAIKEAFNLSYPVDRGFIEGEGHLIKSYSIFMQ